MAEYIEREAVTCRDCYHWGVCDGFGFILDPIHGGVICDDFVKAADVVEVKHGRWEFIGDDYANCTRCGIVFEALPTPFGFKVNNKFCRSCGARMDGE